MAGSGRGLFSIAGPMTPGARRRTCFPPDPLETVPPNEVDEARLVYAEVQAALGARRDDPEVALAFDLDDTVVTGLSRTTRRPGDVPATRHAIAWVMGRFLETGHRILVITGREVEEEAWADLVRALEEVCRGPLDPALMERITISCGGTWAGTRVAVERKVRALRELEAAVLVGDLDHLDGRAARRAGVPFIDVGPHHTRRRLAPGQ